MRGVSEEPCVYSTAHRAGTHSTPYRNGQDVDRTTAESAGSTDRTGAPAGTAGTTEEGRYESARARVEAPAGRAPGSNVVFSARSRENSQEEVFENNKTGFKTDEERSGWWGALKKRFYRDMG